MLSSPSTIEDIIISTANRLTGENKINKKRKKYKYFLVCRNLQSKEIQLVFWIK